MGDSISFRGPCLRCGGSRRMVVFLNGKFPEWYLRCDICGIEGWLDSFFPESEIKAICEQGNLTEIDRSDSNHPDLAEELDRNLQRLRSAMSWKVSHEQMSEDNRAWWRRAGVPDDWQDFWCLGYQPERIFQDAEGHPCVRPAYTIPKFDFGWKLKNIDYRLIDPPLGVGKYRPEFGLPAAPFISRPDLSNGSFPDFVLVAEGSKKAMVSSVHLDGILTIGVPAARSWAGVDQKLRDGPEVLVVLDPDAEQAARRLTTSIGKQASYLLLPTKIDDAFLRGYLDQNSFYKLAKRNSRKPERAKT